LVDDNKGAHSSTG